LISWTIFAQTNTSHLKNNESNTKLPGREILINNTKINLSAILLQHLMVSGQVT
jgi:hypothetical protein